jgi:NAD+ kinase
MQKVIIYYKKDKKITPAAMKIRKALSGKFHITLLESHKKFKSLPAGRQGKYDLMVAVGGDGTVLRGARAVSNLHIPILGVNLGKIGFLSEIKLDELKTSVGKILKGDYQIDERMMISAQIKRKGKKIAQTVALNDVVISKSGIARLIKFSVFVDGELMREHNADGIIISTPTGSTAYNVSVGGPIVYPIYPMFIISAICPHSMSDRPLVIPARRDRELVEIKVIINDMPGEGGGVLLTADGQQVFPLKKNDEIIFREAPFKTKFIRLKKYNFFKVLREKLNWI